MGAHQDTFAEIAVALTLAVDKLRLDLGQTKIIADRINLSPGAYSLCVDDFERDVVRIEAARDLLKNLIDHEAEVRKLAARRKPRLISDRMRSIAGIL